MRRRERGGEKGRRWGEGETCMRVLLCFINPRVKRRKVTSSCPGIHRIRCARGYRDWADYLLDKKIEMPLEKKIAQKSRNSCRARGGEVGAEGIVRERAMLHTPETKYKRSKIIFSVRPIALTSETLCTKLLKISAQFLIWSPVTLVRTCESVEIQNSTNLVFCKGSMEPFLCTPEFVDKPNSVLKMRTGYSTKMNLINIQLFEHHFPSGCNQ